MEKVLLLAIILLISASGHAQTLDFTLANPQPDLMEVWAGTFASGDVDGDGDIDLFMTGITPQKQTKLYLNNGTGNFTEVANTPFPRSGSSQAILKDLDNDGDLDLFFSGNNLLSQNFTHIYRNNGSGIFTQVTNNALPAFIKGAAIADVDNDGDQDIVISTSAVADVYLNNGNAVFSAQGSSVFTPVSGVVRFIDMENDGDQDVIISGASSIKLYQNNGSGNFTLNTNSTFAALSGEDIDVADTDNDGDLDFLINGSGQNLLYTNNGSGIFTQITTTLQQTSGGQNAIADLDNDGDQDILIVGTQAGGLPNIFNIVYRNTGNNIFVQTQILGGEYIADCVVADFTGDGLKDIIIQGFVDDTNVYWNTSSSTCTAPNAPTGTLAITNSTCNACVISGGSIATGTVNGTGGTLEYSTNGGASWSATLPTYNQTGPAQTIIASVLAANGCRSNTTLVGVTAPGTCNTPNAPTGTLAITNSICNACVISGGSIAIGTVSGTGGTLEFSTNGGANWSATLPTYNQTGPAQTILASVLAASGCRSNTTQVGVTVPGTCTTLTPTGTLAITNSTCSACVISGGSIAIGTVSGTGGTLEYSTNGGANWSATLPTYNQTGPAQTILASVVDINGCRSTTTQVGVTVPGTCTTPNAPIGTLAITNSTCNNCVVSGGSIAIGTVSGTGGTLEYSINGGANWSATLPTYNQTGPAQTILASVLAANGCRSNTTQVGVTVPGTCTIPTPTGILAITNSTCSACVVGGGSIAIGMVIGTGGTLEYSTNGGATWSATLPTYNQTGPAQTIIASVLAANGCRSNTTLVGVTAPGTCNTPNAPTGTLAITNSTCSNCVVGGGSIALGTVSGTGGTLQFSTDGGTTWNAALPTYNQSGPAQTILASVLGANGCRSNTTHVGQTTPGTCTTPSAPTGTLAIVNSTCSNCTLSGGSITLGTVSGTGGTLQYSTDGGTTWNGALPTYNQSGPAQTILASVLGANGCRSNTTQVGQTTPGNCTTASAPTGTLAIVNSACNNCVLSGGSIAIGTVSGTGGTLQYSTDGGTTWNAMLPMYNQTGPAQTILASVLDANGCRSGSTMVGTTSPGNCGNQVLTTYYVDGDGDNYGTGPGQLFCTNPGPGFSLQAGDCNDNVSSINPGTTEVCDGIDNNCNGTIDDVDGNTSGNWSSSDVGQAGGSSNFPPCGSDEDDIFNLSATGFSTSSSDKLHAVYQELCGNGEIIVRVLNVSGGGWAGITLRETLMPGSKKVGLKTQLTNNIRREIRTTTNGATNMLNFLRPSHTWLRLVRTGSKFMGYASPNGTTWSFAFSATVSMTGCVYAGLFAESINASVTTTATFDNVSINGVVPSLSANIQHTATALYELTLSVYPNPTSGEMTLSVAGAPERNLQLEVTDAMGRTVRSVELPEDAVFTYPLDLSNEPAGVYYLRLRSESGMVSVQRIVVQK